MKNAFRIATMMALLMGSLMWALATEEQALEAARAIRKQLRELGFEVRDPSYTGALNLNEATIFPRTFYQENEYVIVITGCDIVRDVDVSIYDDDGQLIAKDSKSAATAVATFKAEYTGKYYIKVEMYNATKPLNAHFAFNYGYR